MTFADYFFQNYNRERQSLDSDKAGFRDMVRIVGEISGRSGSNEVRMLCNMVGQLAIQTMINMNNHLIDQSILGMLINLVDSQVPKMEWLEKRLRDLPAARKEAKVAKELARKHQKFFEKILDAYEKQQAETRKLQEEDKKHKSYVS